MHRQRIFNFNGEKWSESTSIWFYVFTLKWVLWREMLSSPSSHPLEQITSCCGRLTQHREHFAVSSHHVIVKMLAKNFSEASTQHKNVVDMVNIAVSTCFTDIFIFFRHEMNINFDFLSSYPSALYSSAVQISTFTRSESRATSECQNRTFQRCRSQFESISTTRHTTLDSNPFFSSSQWRELAVSAQCGQRV